LSASRHGISRIALAALTALAILAGSPACQEGTSEAAQRPRASASRPTFDGEAAMALLRAQCEVGPRVPGTAAHARMREWLKQEMEKSAERVVVQDFRYRNLTLRNVIGIFNEKAIRQVLLCAHWDSRPAADMEITASKRRMPVPGANDGASGVAVLLQLARMFRNLPPKVGVVIALFDGEDYGDFEREEGVFLGSRHFASRLREVCNPAYGILLDMVGDKDLGICREGNSELLARRFNDLVFRIAGELGFRKYFPDTVRYTVTDDHVPINEAGVPCIDLIDFDYRYWHTVEDTPDKCSPESLRIVGEVVAEVVYREPSK